MFDNVDLEEIIEEVARWEEDWFDTSSSDYYLYPHENNGNGASEDLSRRLVEKAREYSLDTERDSPFALLAKVKFKVLCLYFSVNYDDIFMFVFVQENDIMWGGGMPDDTTVVVMRTVKKNSTRIS